MISVQEAEEDRIDKYMENSIINAYQVKIMTKEDILKHAKIINLIKSAEEQLENLRNKYRSDSEHLKQQIENLQKECDHPDYSFFGDPSGNNDSFHRCNLCGYEY